MKPKSPRAARKPSRLFDADTYLHSIGPARKIAKYRGGEVAFGQGDPANDIRFIQAGAVKISVLSRIGKEAVVAMLSPGDFFGEAALITGNPRNATIVAQEDVVLYELKKDDFLSAMNASDPFNKQLRDVYFKREH